MVLERIGFFHFVSDHEKPIEALTAGIETERSNHPNGDISNSLIVLPESFNMGRGYGCSPDVPEIPASAICDGLHSLASSCGVAFVVGILEGRCNTAYYIDASGRQLMCHKVGDDLTKIYDPCCSKFCDERNPLDCVNARIAALICMDATDPEADIKRRRESLLNQVRTRTSIRIVCIPARFKNTVPTEMKEFSGCWCVVANGVWRDRSFVSDAWGKTPVQANGQNEVKILRLNVPMH